MKQKLMAVLPVLHKWASQQQQDVEMPPASPPPSPPQRGDEVRGVDGAGSVQQLPRSYAAAVAQQQQPTCAAMVKLDEPQQQHVEQRKRDRLREQYELYEREFRAAEAWLASGRAPSPCKAPKSNMHAHACSRRQPAREAPPS